MWLAQDQIDLGSGCIREMESSQSLTAIEVRLDEPNLVADASLVQVVGLAGRVGLTDLVTGRVAITGATNAAGANPAAKVMSLVAGMAAGADSIDDMARPRLGATGGVFTGQDS